MKSKVRLECEDHADRCLCLGWCNFNLYHCPYSPDISQCDYDLIPKMTVSLQGIRFRTVNEILQVTDRSLRNLQRLGILNGIQRLPHRCGRVLHNSGDYFERLKDLKVCIYTINSCNNLKTNPFIYKYI